ncbi:MAG: fibronectin type III domain-containing protein [Fervidobacterium sp.]|nr:fibronectin type III domain-containing protein [Fervidobacterium sp.]
MKRIRGFFLIAITFLTILFNYGCTSKQVSITPELVSPENNATNVPFNNVVLRFKATVGKTYDIIVKDSATNSQVFTKTVKAEKEIEQVIVPKGIFSPEKKYKWYIRLTNNDSVSSSQWVFTTKKNTPPTVSGLLPNGTSGHPFGMLGLTWKASDEDDDDLTFTVRIYEKGKDKPYIETSVATDTYLAKNLRQTTTYRWSVEVKDKWGAVVNSPFAEFTTKANEPPEKIELISPQDKSTNVKFNNLLLKWKGLDRDFEELRYTVYLYQEGTAPSNPIISLSPEEEYQVTGLAPNTNYILQIEAYDTHNEKASQRFSFRTKVNTPPPVPVLQEPANNSRVNLAKVSSLNFRWGAVVDPDEDYVSYRFVIKGSSSERFMDPVNDTQINFSQIAGFFKVGERYQWYVEAKDKHGAKSTSATFTFETYRNNPPSVPSNPFPSNNKENLPNRISLFSWTCSDPDGDELKYDLYMGDSPDNLKLKASDLRKNEYSTSELFEFGKRYYWKVVARDGYNDPVEGPVWSFRITETKIPPTAPVLISPSDNQKELNFNSVTLKWKSSSDPDDDKASLEYYVYYGRADELNMARMLSGQTADEISITISGLQPVTTYFWRVEVKDPFGNYAYSSTWKFTTRTNTAPLWPSNPSPEDGTVITSSSTTTEVVLGWDGKDPDNDRLTYEVYISRTSDFTNVTPRVTADNYLKLRLESPAKYYWYVVAKDPHGGVTQGDIWTFEIRK